MIYDPITHGTQICNITDILWFRIINYSRSIAEIIQEYHSMIYPSSENIPASMEDELNVNS
jgi:hypothetical protein